MDRRNWKEQLASVEARLQRYEEEAQKAIRQLLERGNASRRELDELVAKVRSGELLAHAAELRARAEKTGNEVLERLERVPQRAFERIGIATRPQLEELGERVNRLSRRLEQLSRQARTAAARRSARSRRQPDVEKPNA